MQAVCWGVRDAWTLSSLRLVERTGLVWEDLVPQYRCAQGRGGERSLGARTGGALKKGQEELEGHLPWILRHMVCLEQCQH